MRILYTTSRFGLRIGLGVEGVVFSELSDFRSPVHIEVRREWVANLIKLPPNSKLKH